MSAEAAAVAEHAHGDDHGDGADRFLQHHFQDLKVQANAARLGMWLFLSTEILLFGGLFICYALFRALYNNEQNGYAFHEASHLLSAELGLVDTFILITSSFTMALAIHFVGQGKKNVGVGFLLVTIGFGFGFLCVHGYEYLNDIREGALPGVHFHVAHLANAHGASLFFTLYFAMTGLHSLHVLVGAIVLSVITYYTWRGDYSARYMNPLENGGLYWHLIDLIWIFLYPLLYLIAK
jgi:cytochrome c oxidase subunit III